MDAAQSLAHWPLDAVAVDSMRAMLSYHILSDYMAVAIAKQHPADELINFTAKNETKGTIEGSLEVIIGIFFDRRKHLF